jgi:hypothetical protein
MLERHVFTSFRNGTQIQVAKIKIKRKSFGIGPAELGLTLEDGETILRQVQGQIIR